MREKNKKEIQGRKSERKAARKEEEDVLKVERR
jgi:hypothetical protein